MKAEIIFFSATGTTKNIVWAISRGLNCETQFTDITLPENRNKYRPIHSDIIIIATPIYGERIPRFVFEFIEQIEGEGRPLAVVSVYGNMGFGISLEQFETFALNKHFCLIAAGTFIGEHTFAKKNAPVALGRPNEADLAEASAFGRKIRRKLEDGSFDPIIIPKSKLPMFITNFPDRGTRFLIKQPAVDLSACSKCGVCAKKCPVGAIDSKTLLIDEQKCIRCYACVRSCPNFARLAKFRLGFFEPVFGYMGARKRDNRTFL
ncbi:MAG: 4Fe-4S ferredoxin [Clostridia bacterium]|nr:4Fe-4S ferredoxin [Clostridia bacterium]